MRTIFLAAAAALAAVSAPVFAAPPTKFAPAEADWSRAITDTGIGWRMGNPNAPRQVVEYGSFNCPHCALFEKSAMPAIRKLVTAGKISFEFRPKLLFPHDPSAGLLALCTGKDQAFAYTSDYMANAPTVLTKLRTAYKTDQGQFDRADAQGVAATAKLMARIGQMAPIAARHGVSPARAAQCLADPKLIKRVDDNEKAALAAGVTGTPTFFINGKAAEPADLEALGIPVTL